jgi:hypothetical protein
MNIHPDNAHDQPEDPQNPAGKNQPFAHAIRLLITSGFYCIGSGDDRQPRFLTDLPVEKPGPGEYNIFRRKGGAIMQPVRTGPTRER